MTAWIDACLADAAIRRRGPVRQVRSWGRSALRAARDGSRADVGEGRARGLRARGASRRAARRHRPRVRARPWSPRTSSVGGCSWSMSRGRRCPDLRSEPAAWTATLERFAEAQRVLAEDLVVLAHGRVSPRHRSMRSRRRSRDLLADDDLLLIGRPGGSDRGRGCGPSGPGRPCSSTRPGRWVPEASRRAWTTAISRRARCSSERWDPSSSTGPTRRSRTLPRGAASFLDGPRRTCPTGLECRPGDAAYLAPWAGRGRCRSLCGRRSERADWSTRCTWPPCTPIASCPASTSRGRWRGWCRGSSARSSGTRLSSLR